MLRRRGAYAKRDRVPLFSGLSRLFAALKERFLLRRLLRERRDTAPGLYFRIVRRFRLSPLRKKSGETPRAYLMRVGRELGAEPRDEEVPESPEGGPAPEDTGLPRLMKDLADAAEKDMFALSGREVAFRAYPEAARVRSEVRREARLYLLKKLIRGIRNRNRVPGSD